MLACTSPGIEGPRRDHVLDLRADRTECADVGSRQGDAPQAKLRMTPENGSMPVDQAPRYHVPAGWAAQLPGGVPLFRVSASWVTAAAIS